LTVGNETTIDIYLNLTYSDNSFSTGSVSFYVNDVNATRIYTTAGAPAGGLYNTSHPVPNIKTMMYMWGFYANSSTFGNISSALGITMKGTGGAYVDIAPCVNANGVPYATGWGNRC
jgi:hypothetical protein